MRLLAIPCVLVLLSAPAPAPKERTNAELFEGEWEVVKGEQESKDLAQFIKDSAPVTIYKGGKYTSKGTGLEEEVGEFKLDPKAKIPTIDYTITGGVHKGNKQLGIYKLDGDTLTICLAEEGADKRPTAFKTAEDSPEYVLFVMKRKKK
jgi:uncharacterized protein (TIGR03067 family)